MIDILREVLVRAACRTAPQLIWVRWGQAGYWFVGLYVVLSLVGRFSRHTGSPVHCVRHPRDEAKSKGELPFVIMKT